MEKFQRPAIAASVTDMELELLGPEEVDAIDLIELRVDHFKDLSDDYILSVFKRAEGMRKPVIATIRSHKEGGERFIDDDRRISIIGLIADHADLVDVEAREPIFDEARCIIKDKGKVLVGSFHDFQGTPSYNELTVFVDGVYERGADVVKIAVFARDMRDIQTMTRLLLDYEKRGIVTICMGKRGLASRVFFPMIGSLFTFSAVGAQKAPGQVSVVELRGYMNTLSR